MATLGTLTAEILFNTNRDESFAPAVKEALRTAIRYMESNYFWQFKKTADLIIQEGENNVGLPPDFCNMITARYLWNGSYYSIYQGFLNGNFPDVISTFANPTSQQGQPSRYALFGNTLYVNTYMSGDTPITIYYYYKDEFYPTTDFDTSIWFDDNVVDATKLKAMERFYHDTLQSFDNAQTYRDAFNDFMKSLMIKNNYRQTFNKLSI